jgi:NAD(P)-dependent dehydrogenase (short-subunit alcohol dehydrogenase family)
MESETRPITVITGGSRGIGAATAIRLARAGHHLAVAYRDDTGAAERLAAAVTAQGVQCVTVRTDVTREEDVDHLFTIASQRLGTVTGLVNNAGLTAHIGDLIDTPVEVIRRVIDVNLVGVVLCARRAAQLMSARRAGGGGAIVNVSSAAATLGSAHEYVHYAAAKAAVDALTVGLAKELAGDKIRVNAVAPGIVRTRIHADAGDPGRADRLASRIPVGRAGDPDEIAAVVAWLLSSEASYVTGAVVRAGGGL